MLGVSGNNYTAITGAGQTAWIVGQGGSISNLVGGMWQLVSSHPEKDFHEIWMNSATDGRLVGDGGTMDRTQDGLTWTATTPPPAAANLNSVWGSGSDNVWAVGDSGTVLRYNGQAWMSLAPAGGVDISKHTLSSIYGAGPNNIWIAGYQTASAPATILHWDGTTLSSMPTPPDAFSIVVYNGTPYVAVGSANGIYQLSGSSWNQVSNLNATGLAVQGNTLFAAGSGGLSRYDGTNWTTDMTGMFSGVYASSATRAWAWGGLGNYRLVRWDGSKWSDFDTFPQSIYGMSGSGTSDVWTAGARGSILHLNQ